MSAYDFQLSREHAQALDAADPLYAERDAFNYPLAKNGKPCVYFCGNSLGLQPKLAASYVQTELDNWANLAVLGHHDERRPWIGYHRLAAQSLAQLTGSDAREVIAMNTLTVNIHLMMAAFFKPTSQKYKIVIESTAFPSDRYAVVSQLRWHGIDPADGLLEWAPRNDERLYVEDLEKLLGEHRGEVALLLLPGVQYYSGQVLPMQELCSLARREDCRIGLDLAHAIGNVPLALGSWSPDFAVWCHYKYLNAGPGAIGGAFIPERHFDAPGIEPLLGWWSHDEATRFQMTKNFTPAPGAEAWQMSNPPILSLAPVVASLELFSKIDTEQLFEKSRRLTAFLDFLLEKRFAGRVSTITPSEARGCQLSLVLQAGADEAKQTFGRLMDLNVIGDWREPNVIRVAPVPFYNSFEEVYEFGDRLETALGR